MPGVGEQRHGMAVKAGRGLQKNDQRIKRDPQEKDIADIRRTMAMVVAMAMSLVAGRSIVIGVIVKLDIHRNMQPCPKRRRF